MRCATSRSEPRTNLNISNRKQSVAVIHQLEAARAAFLTLMCVTFRHGFYDEMPKTRNVIEQYTIKRLISTDCLRALIFFFFFFFH